jgi:hypothetical protein
MPSPQRIEANRQNAQHSTGPVTPEGKQRSSLNATRHGFTGQNLVITPAEKESYEAHVKGFFAEHSPSGHLESNLVQQLADLHWNIHQIFVQQCNLISLINAISAQLAPAGDPLATANALTQHYKSLNTLSLYDQRRRRAAADVEERLNSLRKENLEKERKQLSEAARHYKLFKAKGQAWLPADSGFDCSLADVEEFLRGQALAVELNTAQTPRKSKSIEELLAESEADLAKSEALLAKIEGR